MTANGAKQHLRTTLPLSLLGLLLTLLMWPAPLQAQNSGNCHINPFL